LTICIACTRRTLVIDSCYGALEIVSVIIIILIIIIQSADIVTEVDKDIAVQPVLAELCFWR